MRVPWGENSGGLLMGTVGFEWSITRDSIINSIVLLHFMHTHGSVGIHKKNFGLGFLWLDRPLEDYNGKLKHAVNSQRPKQQQSGFPPSTGFLHPPTPRPASLTRVYNKTQLIALWEACGIQVSTRSSKTVFVQALLGSIAKHTCIPFSAPVDNRMFTVVERSESDGHIRMRLSRGMYLHCCHI